MNLKRLGMVLSAAGAFLFAYSVQVPDYRNAAAGNELPGEQATPASGKANAVAAADASAGTAADVVQPETPGSDASEEPTLEQSLIVHNSLNVERLMELDRYEVFNSLVAELREQTSAVAAEKRRAYELYLYSRPLIRNGTVSLDVLECGARLCVVELRANEYAVLEQFSRDLFLSDGFESGATANINRYANATGASGEVLRLLFSHDPSINAVTFPAGMLPPDAFDTAEEPPDIH